MTTTSTSPDLQHGVAPGRGELVSHYVLYEVIGDAQQFDRALTWTLHAGPSPVGLDRAFSETPIGPVWQDLIERAFDAWEAVSGLSVTRLPNGSADANITIGWMADPDGFGGWGGGLFRQGGWEGYVWINPEHQWSDRTFFNIMLHEIGHALGIDHSDVGEVVMSGPPLTQYWYTGGWDRLQPDDVAAAQAVWGPPGDPAPNLAETGRLIEATPWAVSWRGTSGDDTLVANKYLAHDVFAGGFGADSIEGGYGDDTLMGNGVYWTNWNNPQHGYWSRTYGGHDDGDTIFGGPGNDFINGNAGLDYLDGGPGNDTIYGGQNAGAWTAGKTRTTTIHLREGYDTLKGGPGDDFLNGNMGTDILYGGPGNDLMRGGQDEDVLYGEEGDDTLWGDLEGDTLVGGPGADHIITGNDTAAGDGHVDHLHFSSWEAAGDVVYGLEDHDVLWIDGAIATRDQVAALGVTLNPLAQV